MQVNQNYELHGYLDLALTETGFVLPVFMSNDQLYIEIHFNDIITDFIPLPDDYLPAFTINAVNAGYEAMAGDSCCYAFKWHDDIHYGTSKDMMTVFHTLLTSKVVPYYTERSIRSFIKKFGSKTSKPISFIIVDDHKLIRETWSYLLGQLPNYDVVGETGDGKSAIELVKEKKPDIVLLDINMAPLNGFDVLKVVRKISPASKTIAISMHSQPAYAKKILQMGGVGYVTKNSGREEMYYAINQVYSGNRYVCDEIKNNISELVLAGGADKRDLNSLSEREIEIIKLISAKMTSKEIAEKLQVPIKIIEVHRHNILKKLKLKNTTSLIDFVNKFKAMA